MKNVFMILTIAMAIGCGKRNQPQPQAGQGDKDFEALSESYINAYLAFSPASGTAAGFHEYDGKLTDFSKASLEKRLNDLKDFQKKLDAIKPESISPKAFYDYRILQSAILNERFSFEDMESFSKNPMTYAGAIDVNIYIKRDFAPLSDRVKSITSILKQAPNVFKAAKENLADSLPKPYITTAIQVAEGSADFLGKDLLVALKDFKDDAIKKEFSTANAAAIKEIKSFAEYLKKEKLPKANEDYHIGKEKYQRMLASEFISLSPEKILEIGLKELKAEQKIFADSAKVIDPTKPAIEVFKAIQKDHPTAEGLIPDTKKNLEAIRQFLVDKKIISIPSEERVRVEETPAYARATSFASMDTPGAFETKAKEAYYYVTPVDLKWDKKKQEEWLTAFNYYTTDVVSIHEAYPGHYLQFIRLNASDATKLDKLFGSYAFIEGWAHYTEKMVVDAGFGKDKDALRSAKYQVAQSDEALLRLCRLCVSIKMHTQGMTVDEATKFFVDNCYYEEQSAKSEANRGSYDPGYLYYTMGKLQLLKLREDYKAQEGSAYSLQKFNDEATNYGMPPIRLLREKLLKDKSKWEEIL